VVLYKENHMQSIEAATLDRKSGVADLSRCAVEGSAVLRTTTGNARCQFCLSIEFRVPTRGPRNRRSVGLQRSATKSHGVRGDRRKVHRQENAPFIGVLFVFSPDPRPVEPAPK
jgi:hypothetical protein